MSQGPKLGDDVLRIAKQSRRRRLCFPISTKSLQRERSRTDFLQSEIRRATSFCLQSTFCAHSNVLTFPQGEGNFPLVNSSLNLLNWSEFEFVSIVSVVSEFSECALRTSTLVEVGMEVTVW